jgi:hypothetical protein
MARGGGARGGARGGLGEVDLVAEGGAGARWHRLAVREAAWCCPIDWGGALGCGQRLEVRLDSEVLSPVGEDGAGTCVKLRDRRHHSMWLCSTRGGSQ